MKKIEIVDELKYSETDSDIRYELIAILYLSASHYTIDIKNPNIMLIKE
jgi:hypothetical protein